MLSGINNEAYLEAIRAGNLALVKRCIDKGAKANGANDDGLTALHIASGNDHLEIVKFLIETYDVDMEAKDNNGWTALHFACVYSNLEIVKYLIETCGVNKEAKNNNGESACDLASRLHQRYITYYLKQRRTGPHHTIANMTWYVLTDEYVCGKENYFSF